jgi:type II secretory pathway pseudopilin PulG
MLIATFGPSTAWVGKTITYQDGQFILEGHGPVPPGAVLEYDRQGHLTWAHEGLPGWVRGLAQPAEPATRSRATRSAWWVAALVCLAVLLVGGVFAAIAIPAFQHQRDKARAAAVVEGVSAIQAGLDAFFADHNNAYPVPSVVTRFGLHGYMDDWPINPYTGRPMTQGHGAGDFQYSVYDTGLSFDLTAFVANGTTIKVVHRVPAVQANARAIAEGIHSIQVGIESYAIDHNGAIPATAEVTQVGLGTYVDSWPVNPYTGLPMTQGTGQGDFAYSASPGGHSFELTGYGDNGVALITVP